uniref:Protein indeterminate-domain 9 n=1 Tax=Rhizophora mucronata TaxID=61149 RepID=A0A2P2IN43_RHIMU
MGFIFPPRSGASLRNHLQTLTLIFLRQALPAKRREAYREHQIRMQKL